MVALISKVHIKRFCEQCSAWDVLYWALLVSWNGMEGNERTDGKHGTATCKSSLQCLISTNCLTLDIA